MMTEQQIINTIGGHKIKLIEAEKDLIACINSNPREGELLQMTQRVTVLEVLINQLDIVLKG